MDQVNALFVQSHSPNPYASLNKRQRIMMRYLVVFIFVINNLYAVCNLDKKELSIVFAAAGNGNIQTIKKFITNKTNANCQNQYKTSILLKSVFYNQIAVVRYLINKGADINKTDIGGMSPLAAAVKNNYTKLAIYLLSKGADIDMHYFTVIKNNNIEILKTLLNSGLNINTTNEDKTPLLSKAIMWGSYKTAKFLLENGAQVNLPNRYGKTPLMYAAHFKRVEMVRLLLKYHANIHLKTDDGRTVLDYATFERGNPEKTEKVIKLLSQAKSK